MNPKIANLQEKIQALNPDQRERYEIILDGLNRIFPAGLAPRCRLRETGLISPGTCANEDSQGNGAEGRIIIRGKNYYINEGLALHLCQK